MHHVCKQNAWLREHKAPSPLLYSMQLDIQLRFAWGLDALKYQIQAIEAKNRDIAKYDWCLLQFWQMIIQPRSIPAVKPGPCLPPRNKWNYSSILRDLSSCWQWYNECPIQIHAVTIRLIWCDMMMRIVGLWWDYAMSNVLLSIDLSWKIYPLSMLCIWSCTLRPGCPHASWKNVNSHINVCHSTKWCHVDKWLYPKWTVRIYG